MLLKELLKDSEYLDAFSPVLIRKFADLGSDVMDTIVVPDDINQISKVIRAYLAQGVDVIAVCADMSVDPDTKRVVYTKISLRALMAHLFVIDRTVYTHNYVVYSKEQRTHLPVLCSCLLSQQYRFKIK